MAAGKRMKDLLNDTDKIISNIDKIKSEGRKEKTAEPAAQAQSDDALLNVLESQQKTAL